MKMVIEDVEQVINRPVKDGKIFGLTEWNDRTVKVLVMKDNGVSGNREVQDDDH